MTRLKIMSVFGTRPEAIKFAPVIKGLEEDDTFQVIVVVTAQHREMLDQVLTLFEIIPDYDLDIMKEGQELFDITVRGLEGLKSILQKDRPDLLLIQGDTTTAFTTALAAFYLTIPVGHIEAGLRTFDKDHPFPEEKNRQLISALVDLHFAPTEGAKNNLLQEGISEERIFVTGNTVIDALLETIKKGCYFFDHPVLSKIDFQGKTVILVTAHRRESWGKPLENVCHAIRHIIHDFPHIEIVFSVHLNPSVRKTVRSVLEKERRVHLLEPLDYEPFVHLMNKCHFILTDSGGIQEEAPSLGKPVLVLREVTERPEAVKAGTAQLAGRDIEQIVELCTKLLTDSEAYQRMAQAVNPYGDGQAARRIKEIIKAYLAR